MARLKLSPSTRVTADRITVQTQMRGFLQITHSTFPYLKIQRMDAVSVVTQEQVPALLFSALA